MVIALSVYWFASMTKYKYLDFLSALRFSLLAGIKENVTWAYPCVGYDGLQKFHFYGNCHLNTYDTLFDGETNPHM